MIKNIRFRDTSAAGYVLGLTAVAIASGFINNEPDVAQVTLEAMVKAGEQHYPKVKEPVYDTPVIIVSGKEEVEERTALDGRIAHFHNFYTNSKRGKREFARRFLQTSQYDSQIKDAAKKYGLEPSLLKALIMVESGGNKSVVSHAGARGLTQVMPGTANKHCPGADLRNPEDSISCGARVFQVYTHKSWQINPYTLEKEDIQAALRGYNTGNVRSDTDKSADYASKILAMQGILKKAY